jgi:hypothetical protein
MTTLSSRRIALLAALALTGALLFMAPTTARAADDRPAHDSVVIDSNKDFTAKNGIRSGKGTAANPYVISGWTFHHLEIRDTSSYVKIVNNTIESSLVLDWIGPGTVVQGNTIGDLRVNQNRKRTGAPTAGRITGNRIGVVGQLRHFDGRFANNVVGQKASDDTFNKTWDSVFDGRAVNFDGFNGAIFENNVIYGYMDARLHGHHHSSSYGDNSHHHAAHHDEMDHTTRYHQVWIRNNTIYAQNNGYALAYLDTAHSANDRTAASETNEQLNKPHVHYTKVHITDNKLHGAGLLVDVFNAEDERHTATTRGLMELRNNRITLIEDQIDPWLQTLHGITVWQAEDINLKVIDNTILGQPTEELPGDVRTNYWDYDAGIFLQGLNKGFLQLYGNLVTNRETGVYASSMTKSVRWVVGGLQTKNVQRSIYYDSSVQNKPERRP